MSSKGTTGLGGGDSIPTKIFLYDDKYDSVVRLEEIWKEEGFQTEPFDDEMTFEEMINGLLNNNSDVLMIPAIDVRFPNEIRFKVHGQKFLVADTQSAGFEIIEQLTSTFAQLRDQRYILMSSAEMEGPSLERLNALKKRIKHLQFVSKKESEESVLEKTYELIANPVKLALFGYVKMFETFCDLLDADHEMRVKIIGAELPDFQRVQYSKYIRTFLEISVEAKERISTFMAIELLIGKLHKGKHFNAALSDLKSHKGESLKQMLISGDRMQQEYVRSYLECSVGGGV